MLSRSFAGLLLAVVALPAQAAAPATKTLRVHVIGASVSGGFRDGPAFGGEPGDSVTLHHMLKGWVADHARATTHNPVDMLAMFSDSTRFGQAQLKGVAKQKPDIVVAFDFPFWFAYGAVSGDESKTRKARLAAGLEMMAQMQMPVLLGDLPDMQGAAARMLPRRLIPGPDLLKELNAELAAFAKAHPNFHIVPLAELVRTMKVEGVVLPLAAGPCKAAPGALLQGDRLHATRLGMAFLAYSLQEPLRALFPADHALRAQRWTFEQFVEVAGAEGDLEAILAAAKADEAGGGKGG